MSKEHEKEGKLKEQDVPSHVHPSSGVQASYINPFQAAAEPFPLPEDTPETPPWEKAEFKRKVLSAGFPGSPGSDGAFLAALYKFGGGKIEDWHPPESKTPEQAPLTPPPPGVMLEQHKAHK